MGVFESIDAEVRVKLEQNLYNWVVRDFRTKEHDKGVYTYIVQIHKIRFKTYMKECQLRDAVHYAVELLEELKNINNGGVDHKRLTEIQEEIEEKIKDTNEDDKEGMRSSHIATCIYTDRIWEIKSKLAEIFRVEGAYWMFISNPFLDSAICVVYMRMVDHFDDKEIYDHAAYFLLRAIMRINSQEVLDK